MRKRINNTNVSNASIARKDGFHNDSAFCLFLPRKLGVRRLRLHGHSDVAINLSSSRDLVAVRSRERLSLAIAKLNTVSLLAEHDGGKKLLSRLVFGTVADNAEFIEASVRGKIGRASCRERV